MSKGECFKADLSMKDYVEYFLTNYPETRDNDELLYYMICREIDPRVEDLKWKDVLLNKTDITIPNPRSVSRARRKAQELKPHLAA